MGFQLPLFRIKPAPKTGSMESNVWEKNGKLLAEVRACRDLRRGKAIHLQALQTGQLSNKYVANSIISMFGKCGSVADARSIFHSMPTRDVVSWNSLLQAYVSNSMNDAAVELFDQMSSVEIRILPDARTFVAALTACCNLATGAGEVARAKWLAKGKLIHSRVVMSGCCDEFVISSLICLYGRCGEMVLAKSVFDESAWQNVVSWNALLQGFVDNGCGELALELFDDGVRRGGFVAPTPRSYVAALTACAWLGARDREKLGKLKSGKWLEKGKIIHARAVFDRCCDSIVQNLLVDVYGKCGSMADARRVFEDLEKPTVVAWNALLQGYADNGESEVALGLFDEMRKLPCRPDPRTYVAALRACGIQAGKRCGEMLERGKSLHSEAAKSGCCDAFVEAASIDMYGKCGRMTEARRVFEAAMVDRHPDVVCWTALIQGYVDNGEDELALKMVACMDLSGEDPDSRTFVAAVMACKNLLALELGLMFHDEVRLGGWRDDVVVVNCLVDLYAACGRMDLAEKLFDSIADKNVVSWNTLLSAYAKKGDAKNVFRTFEMMRESDVRPDDITFIHLLNACTDAGLTDRGKECFESMKGEYGVTPNLRHFGCIVDLLGRANCIEEALKVVREMPFEPDSVILCTLLSACLEKNDVVIGESVYESLLAVSGKDSVAHVLMSNILRRFKPSSILK